MMGNTDIKNLSNKDLESSLKYISSGNTGLVFFSESFSVLDYDLLYFFSKKQSEVDSLIVVAEENTLSEECVKLCALLPYVSFICQKPNPTDILKYFSVKVLYKYKNHAIPDDLQKAIESIEDCKVQEYVEP